MDDRDTGILSAPAVRGGSARRAAAEGAWVDGDAAPRAGNGLVRRLRSLAIRALTQMYVSDEKLFVFRVRNTANGIVTHGLSRRNTSVALIGLSDEENTVVRSILGGNTLHDVCGRLMGDVPRLENLGDVALILWAASAVDYPDRRWARERLLQFLSARGSHRTLEMAWALAALCRDREAAAGDLRDRVARRLMSGFDKESGIFAHVVGRKRAGLGSHVSGFADLVYPIHALAQYFKLSGDREALDVASRCADRICRLQGAAGQWWRFYDRRNGRVIERYPVHAVHQDAMAPLALFAVGEARGVTYDAAIGLSLGWLTMAPELDGGSLIDEQAGLIWRKVGRPGPARFSRYAQAVASRLHRGLRVPAVDRLFPARIVDYEDRPFHLGWLLYAWPANRLVRWDANAQSERAPVSR
jgi:hypothetical protein